MYHRIIALTIILLVANTVSAQKKRNKKKVSELSFCGAVYNSMAFINQRFKEQLDFLQVNENDTIVDIGAQSGVFEAVISTLRNMQSVHFVLVDIDSSCLNSRKLAAANKHYSLLKPGTLSPSYTIVINTPDSLWLPKKQYNKVWILNTLHEIFNQDQFLKNVNQITRRNGEVVILEMIPTQSYQLHGGCNKPLRSFSEWQTIFAAAGYTFKEKLDLKQKGKVRLHMIRFIKTA